MHLFIKDSIFHNVWPNFGPRFWDIFLISGNALVNHFFSIVISCENAKNCSMRFLWIRCTFSLKIQFFIMLDLTLAQILRYFLNFKKCTYESLFCIVISCENAENSYEVMRIWCTFSLKIQFFMFGLTLGPDFEIFSQFLEMHLWITSSEKAKNVWGYADQMQLFIKDSIFHNVWPNFGPRFWDIFSISGNALVNHFFAL